MPARPLRRSARRPGARRVALALGAILMAALPAAPTLAGSPVDYPAEDAGFHSYAEMRQEIQDVEAAHPGIVKVMSIGDSAEGRAIWMAKISDNVSDPVEPNEPEVLFDALHHSREHLTPEMALYILHLLVDRYGEDTDVGRQVTGIVDGQVTWIVFMLNPDGLIYDLSAPIAQRLYGPDGNRFYAGWRKNRQDLPGTNVRGIDLNRNWGYQWGCCGGSSGQPSALTYRGPSRWYAPEVRALRDFVTSRVIDGRQRIKAHITWHTAGEQILWPYGYTYQDVPKDMTRLDHRTFVRMGKDMAALNGYTPMQSSGLYVTDGDEIDWLYAKHRIFSFTFEMYPPSSMITTTNRFYPPDELIDRETKRNRDAVLYLLDHAGCPYRAIGEAADWCGPYFDDLEIDRGWTIDPEGADTAEAGAWRRGIPKASPLQRKDAATGQGALVTGLSKGIDVDGGRTTARSPLFRLPEGKTATLRFRWWVGLDATATADDGLTVRLMDETGAPIGDPLFSVVGDGTQRLTGWRTAAITLPAVTAGARVAVQVEARDAGDDATVEAGIDTVRVTVS